MAHILYVRHRNAFDRMPPLHLEKIKGLFSDQTFDVEIKSNADPFQKEQLIVLNPNEFLNVKNCNCSDGSLKTYSIQSNSLETIVKTDLLASRSTWYYFDERKFMVSTSQRILTASIGDFELNKQAMVWFISTGMSKAGGSWNNKVCLLNPNATVRLDISNWNLEKRCLYKDFAPSDLPEEKNISKLSDITNEVFSNISVSSQDRLTLSGGVDCRVILAKLLEFDNSPQAISWGDQKKFKNKWGDISIARKVAAKHELKHQVFDIAPRSFCLEEFFSQFVKFGEGEIDHYSGYLDNFGLWKQLAKRKHRLIRGDEVFGWVPVFSKNAAQISVGFHGLEVFSNFNHLNEYDLPQTQFDDDLKQNENESLATWRDRLYHYHVVPNKLGALRGLKCIFTEEINPLLHPKIIDFTRTLTDAERTDKHIYRKFANRLHKGVPYAKHSTGPNIEDFLDITNLEILNSVLSDTSLKRLISPKLVNRIGMVGLKPKGSNPLNAAKMAMKNKVRKFIPNSLWAGAKKMKTYTLPQRTIALRLYMIEKINRQYREDAHVFS